MSDVRMIVSHCSVMRTYAISEILGGSYRPRIAYFVYDIHKIVKYRYRLVYN